MIRTVDDGLAIGVDNHRRLAKWLNRILSLAVKMDS